MGLIHYLKNGDGRRSLKKLSKMKDKVLALESKYAEMSDADLKAQTGVFKERLKKAKRSTIFSTTHSRL